jgi:hypothetical protein
MERQLACDAPSLPPLQLIGVPTLDLRLRSTLPPICLLPARGCQLRTQLLEDGQRLP